MSSYQSLFDYRFIKISNDVKTINDQGLDETSKQIARLQAQVTVQKTLVLTAQILSSCPTKSALPNQLATRVKHIIKFAFKKESHNPERSTRLRMLECNALKFCGLAYTIRALRGLPELQFEYLLDYVAEFVRSRELVQHLYRSDISKALDEVEGMTVENELSFRNFLMGGSSKATMLSLCS